MDAPRARHPFDLGGLAGVTDVGALARHDGAGGARDAEGGEAALVAVGEGLLERERRQAGRIDAVRQVEVALAALAPGDGDLAAQGEGLEHLRDVAVVGPAGRRPRDDARVRDVARQQRPVGLERGEDVAAERVVGREPLGHEGVGLGLADLGDHGRDVLRAAHVGDGLDEGAVVLDRRRQGGGVVGAAEPAPQDEVGARRDGRGRVDLQEGQALDGGDEVGGARLVEQLRVHRDTPCLRGRELVDHHGADPSQPHRHVALGATAILGTAFRLRAQPPCRPPGGPPNRPPSR
ncbi:hypothetical protein [Terrabacter ginsenosidimutans]|uniref:hypothetical protein n=1 Tax=Terrabacter ginsenosidimutans TaxID=490575 RepID=UPI0031F0A1B9